MTDRNYSEGSKYFSKNGDLEHRALDVFHMNSAFGFSCWEAWLAQCALPAAFPALPYEKTKQAAV
jgi:hypothetical protein